MTIQQAVPESYKSELQQGIHNFATDTINCALYLDSANLGPTTTAYTPTGEVPTGNGYTAGGIGMTASAVGQLDNGVACTSFEEPTWSNATFSARGAMFYNASKANRAVGIYDFGGTVTGNGGDFIVRMPPVTWNQAILRIT